MRLLAVPNWSFGRDRRLTQRLQDALDRPDVTLHYCESDIDHNRTVTAFTAEESTVVDLVLELCDLSFDRIDLTKHVGAHPRIGALDVCPFVLLPDESAPDALLRALAAAERLGRELSTRYEVPVFLYEKSERGRHEADLPSLRRGGFGGLIDRELKPDFGPTRAHPRLGVSVVGVRDFLIALNVNLATDDLIVARGIAATIRDLRADGDPRFLGVRALGLPLASRAYSQVSVNVTMPDVVPVDPIVEWIGEVSASHSARVAGTELIGVIRRQDLPTAERLPVRPEQVL